MGRQYHIKSNIPNNCINKKHEGFNIFLIFHLIHSVED